MKKKLFSLQGLYALVLSMTMLFTTGNIFGQTSGYVTIGEGGTGNTGGTQNYSSSVSPITPGYKNFRYQVLYTKAEIEAAGGVAGNITRLAWNVHTSTTGLTNYTVSMGNTSATSLGSHNANATTQVYTVSNYSPSTGFNDLTFSTAFTWNGTGNIIINVCYSRLATSTVGGSVYTMTGTSPTNRYIQNATSSVCSSNTTSSNFSTKPQIRLQMQKAVPVSCNAPTSLTASAITSTSAIISWTAASPAPANNYEWSRTTTNTAPSGAGTAVSGTSISQTGLSAGTGYYFWLRSKCNATTFSEWISISFATRCLAPTVSPTAGTRCGTGSVNLNATASEGTLYWWDAAIGGNLLGTGTSFNTPAISETTTFYASAGQTLSGNNTVSIGNGSKTSTIASQSPFHSATIYKGQASNYLIKASELLASGIAAGYITSLGLDIVTAGGTMNTFYIKVGSTNAQDLSSGYVIPSYYYYGNNYNGTTYTPTTGVNNFDLSGSGFYWDGTSNVSIFIYWQNTTPTGATSVKYDDGMSFSASRYETLIGSSWSLPSSVSQRPKFVVNGKGLCMSNRVAATATITLGTNTYYQDLDGDGYGNASVSSVSCTQPAGYVTNDTDCDDTDNSIWRTESFLIDADGDGYHGGETGLICYGLETPAGLILESESLGYDCNDTNGVINTGATEVCWNNIDDNCDGDLSEGCATIVVNMATPNNYTLPSIATAVSAMPYTYPGVKTYRFSIKNNVTNVMQEVMAPTRFVTIPVNMRTYDANYSITASAVINGEVVPYAGNTIVVYTPSLNEVGLIKLASTSCGTTLSRLGASISANPGLNAILYTFRARLSTDNINPTYYFTTASASRFTSMNAFAGLIPQYDASYSISVSYYYTDANGSLAQSAYGKDCFVKMPNIPTVGLASPTCGSTLSSLGATISAAPATYAITYEFRIRLTSDNGMSPIYSYTMPNTSRFSTMSSFQDIILQEATSYNVSVRYNLMIDGAEVWSNYGAECILMTAPTQGVVNRTTIVPFTAVAYPNPFSHSFLLDVKSSNTSNVAIAVYDMLGRLIQEKQANINELETTTIGSNYPSGVYNVIVTQDGETKAVRVVKR